MQVKSNKNKKIITGEKKRNQMQCLFLVKEQYATYNTATEANKKVLNVTTICCQRSVHYE